DPRPPSTMASVKKLLVMTAATVAGAGCAELVRRTPYSSRISALSLVGVSVVYPLTRRGWTVSDGGHLAFATAAVAITATANESVPARRVVAGGWLAHAVMDLAVGHGPDSRLPGWYPAVCAGFDIGYAARLAV
ncbi:MAG TPA: hypothetical protein PKA04_02410, partial [Marmoricola sp.]|nr:hypothetical protein [Marmoricola sp.]